MYVAMSGSSSEPPLHGFLLAGQALPPPTLVAACAEVARPGFASEVADEFLDSTEALQAKVKAMAALIRGAQRCVAYTGAGLSTAAGIGDYATKASSSSAPTVRSEEKDWPNLAPTVAHRVLTAMHHASLLHAWVQQNHDGK